MHRVLAICGSGNPKGSNVQLLRAIADHFVEDFEIELCNSLGSLPLFTPDKFRNGAPESVELFRSIVSRSDAVIISTPEYLHNIPAVLKNALEWMTESGELAEKPVLAITFTPAPPRGEYAMRSMLQSLKASKAKVVAELPLYQNQMRNEAGEIELNEEHQYLLSEALNLL